MIDAYPSPEETLDRLGDKVAHALGDAVVGARVDLTVYRQAFPGFVADHTNRGLSNWIHDRIWAHLQRALDDVADVALIDIGPTREVLVGTDFRIRIKRHSPEGAIRSYPTQSALDFIRQDPLQFTLLGAQTLNLTAGYSWDAEARSIGEPVLSLRDGSFFDDIWMVDLPHSSGPGAAIRPILPRQDDGPSRPTIDLPRLGEVEDEGADSE